MKDKHWKLIHNTATLLVIIAMAWTLYNNYQYKKLNLLYEQQIESYTEELNEYSVEINEFITRLHQMADFLQLRIDLIDAD